MKSRTSILSQPDFSFESEIDNDDINDSDFKPSIMENSNHKVEIDVVNDTKFVVYESMLDQLVSFIRCKRCALPAGDIEKTKLGTCIGFKIFCEENHLIVDWRSQPLIGKMPAFNMLLPASIFFSGSIFETFRKASEFSGLNFVNKETFYRVQRVLVIPAINQVFKETIQEARSEIKDKNSLSIMGDGRFDSLGKSAKYCTYTCQTPDTKKIIAVSTLQTSKGKGSAPLELEGFKNCLTELERGGYNIVKVATDRNMQLAKWLRENRALIKRIYDTWHFAKNITSKLRKLAKRKGCKIIQEWIRQIGNHLFWCADNCGGDAEKIKQMWKSLLHHISNRHRFKRSYPKYPKCSHKPLTKKEALKKKWIAKDSIAYDALEKVILDIKTLNDMEHLVDPLHTGNIEVFHSVINSYAPKKHEFELNVMDARVKLAVIDYNHNTNRNQATVTREIKGSAKKGEKQWKFVSSKLSKAWVAKERKEPKSFLFVKKLMFEVLKRKEKGEKLNQKASELADRLIGPKNIALTERPETKLILDKHLKVQRFKK